MLLDYQQLLKTQTAVFLMGPTASGKTDLVIRLAQKMPIRIISVDSALIYQGMDIGTAKPDEAILKQYPHALVDICKVCQTYNVAQFSIDARKVIAEAFAHQMIPVLVGGASFYFHALEYGLSPLPSSVPEIRLQLELDYQKKGGVGLYQRLHKIDPQSAKQINSNDKQRIMRALEVYEITGKTLSILQQQAPKNCLSNPIKKIALLPDRKLLHQRIEQRFYQMLERGLLAEVRQFYDDPSINQNMPSMRCVGYRQVWQYFTGQYDYKQMIEQSIIATRQLCKRQITWLRSEKNVQTLTHSN